MVDPFVRVIQHILELPESAGYKQWRYSLIHKVISDATHSSTGKWRYRRPEFFWSEEAVELLERGKRREAGGDPARPSAVLAPEWRKQLRQEHVVPTSVVINHLLGLSSPEPEAIAKALQSARLVCVVTKQEDGRLHKKAMPPGHEDFFAEPWARYDHPKKGPRIARSKLSGSWTRDQVDFIGRLED
jgi:hypothetical protein